MANEYAPQKGTLSSRSYLEKTLPTELHDLLASVVLKDELVNGLNLANIIQLGQEPDQDPADGITIVNDNGVLKVSQP